MLLERLRKYFDLIRNTGVRYLTYYLLFKVSVRSGLITLILPILRAGNFKVSLSRFQKQSLFPGNLSGDNQLNVQLKQPIETKSMADSEELIYFHGIKMHFGGPLKWITHPLTGQIYSVIKHSQLTPSFATGSDIKYLWEPARFEFIYPILREDASQKTDQSHIIFDEILSFIDHAQINAGPNYTSAQEIAIRILNWIVALSFYKNSVNLTEEVFHKITDSILSQSETIYSLRSYSKNLVRNNHVLSEAAALYTVGVVFPEYKHAKKFISSGWCTFEQEVNYQFNEDGSYIQQSMNYQRMAMRLATWMICIGKKNSQTFTPKTVYKLSASAEFIRSMIFSDEGEAPNYGNNDGTNLFAFTSAPYADFRQCVSSLSIALTGSPLIHDPYNDVNWFGIQLPSETIASKPKKDIVAFEEGGYYLLHGTTSRVFVRCTTNKVRPAQSDNLHIDLAYKGINLLRDSGTFEYNTTAELVPYFYGSKGHNVLILDGRDQMTKGKRFIWHYWSSAVETSFRDTETELMWEGSIKAYKKNGNYTIHSRKIALQKQSQIWMITDTITPYNGEVVEQLWHLHPDFDQYCTISASTKEGEMITPKLQPSYFSPTYGVKENARTMCFISHSNYIQTRISFNH